MYSKSGILVTFYIFPTAFYSFLLWRRISSSQWCPGLFFFFFFLIMDSTQVVNKGFFFLNIILFSTWNVNLQIQCFSFLFLGMTTGLDELGFRFSIIDCEFVMGFVFILQNTNLSLT